MTDGCSNDISLNTHLRYKMQMPNGLGIYIAQLRVDFYHIQSFTGLFDPRMIRGTVDLQYLSLIHI